MTPHTLHIYTTCTHTPELLLVVANCYRYLQKILSVFDKFSYTVFLVIVALTNTAYFHWTRFPLVHQIQVYVHSLKPSCQKDHIFHNYTYQITV